MSVIRHNISPCRKRQPHTENTGKTTGIHNRFQIPSPGVRMLCRHVQIQSHRLSWLFNTRYPLFQKYTRPIKGYTVREIHALNGNRCNAYVLCFEKGNKKFFVGGKGCGYAEICTKDRTHRVDSMDYWGVPGRNTITPHSFKYLKEEEGEYRDICLKAYNLHFDSAKKYTNTDFLQLLPSVLQT